MAEARMTLSLMDTDLVEGMVRAILALHTGNAAGACGNCLEQSPCSTVRVIASFQDASVYRVSNPPPSFEDQIRKPKEPWQEDLESTNRRQTHRFLYPECPQFSGGICNEHKDTPLAAGL